MGRDTALGLGVMVGLVVFFLLGAAVITSTWSASTKLAMLAGVFVLTVAAPVAAVAMTEKEDE